MTVTQITAVVENSASGNEDHGTWRITPNEEATIYGLGDDGKVYYWGVTKKVRVESDEPDEDGETHHYDRQHGWIEYRP